MWAKEVWEEKTPDNVQTELDDTIPMGGSQHQKIVVIDDELVFSGGMDVSTNRWDTRDHPVVSEERDGPDGEYGPLHDVQMVSSGPVVADFSKLVRWRWQRVADSSPIDIREDARVDENAPLPDAWPQDYPLFEVSVHLPEQFHLWMRSSLPKRYVICCLILSVKQVCNLH